MTFKNYFESLNKKYTGKAVFLAVYISEAHAKDEWPIGNVFSFANQPVNQEERCTMAKLYIEKWKFETIPMYVDSMENTFQDDFAAWPFRFYGIENGNKLTLKAQPDMSCYSYDVTVVEKWLEERLG